MENALGSRESFAQSTTASTVGRRRESAHTHNENAPQEDALRALLMDDPNNENAFRALVNVVKKNCSRESDGALDPLKALETGEIPVIIQNDRETQENLAVWALAEEFSGHPRAWFPVVELARLSLHEDPEEAIRRLTAAVVKDASGRALERSISLLLENELAAEAYNLGLGLWRPNEHPAATGISVVRAALASHRVADARREYEKLLVHVDPADVRELDSTLEAELRNAE